MDPISITPLVISAWKLLEPYAKKLGNRLFEKSSDALPDVVEKVWEMVKEKMDAKEEAKSVFDEFVAKPEDPGLQFEYQYQLKQLLEADQDFAQKLDSLLQQNGQSISYSIHAEGESFIVQGDSSIGVGKDSMYIGGYVSGDTVFGGDRNKVNTKNRKTRKK